MKIAVLMSTYNGHYFLDKQLKSIAEQTVACDITLYIRDDASTDDTCSIINKWINKIDIVLFKGDNIGPARSFWDLFMNKNIQADYYAFCDQDDIWDKDKIERGINRLKNEVKPALWCSNCRLINSKGELLKDVMTYELPNLSITSQLVCGSIQGCAMIFNQKLRDCVIKKNPLPIPMHDFVVITYAIAMGKVIYDSAPSFCYRLHENNVVAKNGKNVIKRCLNSLNKWFSNKHKYETSNYAKMFLEDNSDYIDAVTKEYILDFINSKRNFSLRLKIINSPLTSTDNKAALRSFKIRVLFGII